MSERALCQAFLSLVSVCLCMYVPPPNPLFSRKQQQKPPLPHTPQPPPPHPSPLSPFSLFPSSNTPPINPPPPPNPPVPRARGGVRGVDPIQPLFPFLKHPTNPNTLKTDPKPPNPFSHGSAPSVWRSTRCRARCSRSAAGGGSTWAGAPGPSRYIKVSDGWVGGWVNGVRAVVC